MDEKELRTSPKQRFFIILIAILMLGSMLASYVAIVVNGGKSSTSTSGEISEEKLAQYESEYNDKLAEFQGMTTGDFSKFSQYLSVVGEFDKAAAEEGGVKTKDLLVGDGRELTDGDTDYLAYYVGWCPSGEVFDSSLDDPENATGFKGLLEGSPSMIEGWNRGIAGMKIGGVRRITIPSAQAYSDQKEICDELNQPIRFLVMLRESDDSLAAEAAELYVADLKLQYGLYYGVDYEAMVTQ